MDVDVEVVEGAARLEAMSALEADPIPGYHLTTKSSSTLKGTELNTTREWARTETRTYITAY
eukprot:CAMPEP_0119005820 /NCGR_PEP_ID=MMETSP1176-20130426/1948_1 /TAXON_ID=265551 /ORGANISM="Synedropsis recta cf, Strain CCMP1620" /LENGTH=61 /DNA_ID=CAMNT_0006957667 /DNA_START=46 /DNA_END=231 /DNA_ORIENTATION=+